MALKDALGRSRRPRRVDNTRDIVRFRQGGRRGEVATTQIVQVEYLHYAGENGARIRNQVSGRDHGRGAGMSGDSSVPEPGCPRFQRGRTGSRRPAAHTPMIAAGHRASLSSRTATGP